jgi:5'-phosphate synthase pdxT subunit
VTTGREDPVVGVLALQGDVREHLAALAECDVVARPVRRPTELAEVDALVLPGGESTTMSRLLDRTALFDPVAERLAAGMPVLGTCAGMILLAATVLDGRADQRSFAVVDITVRRNAFGRQVDSFEAELAVTGFDAPFHALFIRAPWVEKVGHDVQVVATVAAGEAMGRIVAVRQAHLLATSFHPEITGDHRFHQLFVEQVAQVVN